ncbi:hypothetical protein N7537_000417 [Penicillium hordei]|uniref:Uncharacterized protein n=1 Tax=Penicillium hordei TaxID=40994 RepID=A0AAD6EDK9_9EURO|nr:uncharacterized protein N7537_000417 [Penicillium hordei]KAJ5615303.1 hypothetical protein N7537_000417 [Penicillium hordei]
MGEKTTNNTAAYALTPNIATSLCEGEETTLTSDRQVKSTRPGLTPSTITWRDIHRSPRPTTAESSQKAPDVPYKRVLIAANRKTKYAV